MEVGGCVSQAQDNEGAARRYYALTTCVPVPGAGSVYMQVDRDR